MRGWTFGRSLAAGAAVVLAIGVTALSAPVSSAAGDATIYLVQGLPGKTLSFAVDGKTVASNQKSGSISKPIAVHSGKRRVTVSSSGDTIVDQTVSVGA